MSDGHATNQRHSFVLQGPSLEVTVWRHAICWDTPKKGEPAGDPPFEGVNVWLNTNERSERTKADGKAIFEGLKAGASYTISIDKPGYKIVPGSAPSTSASVQQRTTVVVADDTRSYADILVRKERSRLNDDGTWTIGRECDRRHDDSSTPQTLDPPTLSGLFWGDQPVLLTALASVWIASIVGMAVAGAIGLIAGSLVALSAAGIAAAMFAGVGGIIHGETFAKLSFIAAGAIYIAVAFVTFMAAMTPDPYAFGILTGLWTALGFGFLGARREL
jgi:hypothetical protein